MAMYFGPTSKMHYNCELSMFYGTLLAEDVDIVQNEHSNWLHAQEIITVLIVVKWMASVVKFCQRWMILD